VTSEPTELSILNALSPHAVAGYLKARGWRDEAKWGAYGRLYVLEKYGVKHEIVLPTKSTIADFARRMDELVTELAAIEGESRGRILTDLSIAPYDVIRLKAKDADVFGSVSLSAGEELFDIGRSILSSAAAYAATRRPDPDPKGRPPDSARDYLQRVRLGQTEKGSFVMTMLSPFAFEPAGQTPDIFGEPFGRRVVQQLSDSLGAVETALVNAVSDGPRAFETSVGSGVSAKLCKALSQLADVGGGAEVSVAWSAQRPIERAVHLDVQKSAAPVLLEAASLLAAVSPPQPVSIQGTIVGVMERQADLEGTVRILANVEGRLRPIQTQFRPVERETIFRAFQEKTAFVIAITGELIRSTKPWTLANPRDFTLIVVNE
jgi:hypothetical protein